MCEEDRCLIIIIVVERGFAVLPVAVSVGAILTETWSEYGVFEVIVYQLVFCFVCIPLLILFRLR